MIWDFILNILIKYYKSVEVTKMLNCLSYNFIGFSHPQSNLKLDKISEPTNVELKIPHIFESFFRNIESRKKRAITSTHLRN